MTSVKNRLEGLNLPSQALIGGKPVEAADGQRFACISPITGELLTEVASGGSKDIDIAVNSAREALASSGWDVVAPRQRKLILRKIGELVDEHRRELVLLNTADTGKAIGWSDFEVTLAAQQFEYFSEAIDKVYGEVIPTGPDAYATVTSEPFGVVGAVVPWNFPLLMPTWKVAPALAAGNAVVLKPAEQAPLVALRLGELALEAGLPEGLLNVVPGIGEVAGKALGLHNDVDKIGFTGSTAVGKQFLRYASESNMKMVSLECGGKSPNVVLADAPELEALVSTTAEGIFGNAGQVCNAGSRLVIHESRVDEVMERLEDVAKVWQPADPFDDGTNMGSMVDEAQMKQALDYIELGVEEGAEIAFGGDRVLEESGGFFVEPTVLSGVTNDMRVAREEIFGPVLTVLTFSTEAEAVRIANDTSFGLAAAVWTRDVEKAHKLSRSLKAGNIYINCYDVSDLSLPFGGFKESGFGRDKSLHALRGYTQLKSTYMKFGEA